MFTRTTGFEISVHTLSYIRKHLHGGSQEDRQETARVWRTRLLRSINRTETKMASVEQDWQHTWANWFRDKPTTHPVELPRFEKKTRSWRLFGCIAAGVEAYFAGLFATSWSAMPPWQAIALAELLAILLAVLAAVHFHGRFDDSLPKDSVGEVKRAAGGLATAAGLLIGAFYLSRFFPIGAKLFPWLTGSISIILPLVAGACFLVAHVHRDLNDPAYTYTSLIEYREEVSLVLEEANEVLGLRTDTALRESEGTEPISTTDKVSASARIAPVILLLLLAHAAQAQVVTVREWWDSSGSLHPGQLEYLRRSNWQEPLLAMHSVKEVELYRFATIEDTLGMQGIPVRLKDFGYQKSCPAPTEAERFLKVAKERHEKDCQEMQDRAAAARDGWARERAGQVEAAIHRLDLRGPARQSCIYQVIARCLADSASIVNLIVTDGNQENCPAPAGSLKPFLGAPVSDSRVILILVPGKNDGSAIYERMEERAREIKKRAPSVTIVPSFQAKETLAKLFAQ
jgi:hypothetical protein